MPSLTPADLDAIAQLLAKQSLGQLPPYMLGTQLSYVATTTPLVTGGPNPMVAANPMRVGLLLATWPGTDLRIGIHGTVTAETGWVLNDNIQSIWMNTWLHGILPQLGWDYVTAASSGFFYVVEMIWRQS